MDATTVAVNFAKNVFELVVADARWRIVERHRLSRSQFERRSLNRSAGQVVMEACGSAHHWARFLQARGLCVVLLSPRYVRAYVKRNKTDAADAAALLEAAPCADIVLVQVKSIEQQALQSLHRVRSAWTATRTARINMLRGVCREFGIGIAVGSRGYRADRSPPGRSALGRAGHAASDPGLAALRSRHRPAHRHRDGRRHR